MLRQHEERNAEAPGTLQGNVTVRNLINIHSCGSASGIVHYGKLAIRNVPPSLDVTVEKGRAISITRQDLTALDADDEAKDLIFTISHAKNGFVRLRRRPHGRSLASRRPISRAAA